MHAAASAPSIHRPRVSPDGLAFDFAVKQAAQRSGKRPVGFQARAQFALHAFELRAVEAKGSLAVEDIEPHLVRVEDASGKPPLAKEPLQGARDVALARPHVPRQ